MGTSAVGRVLRCAVDRAVLVRLGGERARAFLGAGKGFLATIARTSELLRPFPFAATDPCARARESQSAYTTPHALLAIPGFLAFILIPSSA